MTAMFDISTANIGQRQCQSRLDTALLPYAAQGPYASTHNWPYYLIHGEKQTVSVRRIKKEDMGETFVVYENFGDYTRKQRQHHCPDVEHLHNLLDILI